jgi:hypothetical protein
MGRENHMPVTLSIQPRIREASLRTSFAVNLLHPGKIDILKVSNDKAQRLAGIRAVVSAGGEGEL